MKAREMTDMASCPLVTVLISVRDAMPYLKPAFLSIQHQTHKNLEILIIDDGSTDGSKELVEGFADRDRRVRLFSPEHRGLVATLNQGLDLASGEFIARMDADDVAYPDRIARQLDFMRLTPDAMLTGMNADYLYGGRTVISKPPLAANPRAIAIANIFHTFLVHPDGHVQSQPLNKFGSAL